MQQVPAKCFNSQLFEKLTARASRKRGRSDIAVASEQHQEDEDISTDSSTSNNTNSIHNSNSNYKVALKEDDKVNDNVSSVHNNDNNNNKNHKKVKMAPRVKSIVDSIPLELAQNIKKELVLNEYGKQVCAVTRHNMLRPLHCEAQQYAWGRLGSSSTVARMKDAQAMQEDDDMFAIDETKPYAELWLGTHPSGMSRVTIHRELQHGYDVDAESSSNGDCAAASSTTAQKCSLLDYVKSNPDLHCGDASMQDLSFLLKVLSVRKVLSIQSHPDKKLAEKLHAERPNVYKDPNHKPEMAIALSESVRAMFGFRPLVEIADHLQEYPEFRTMMGEAMAQQIEACAQQGEDAKEVLRTMFQNYLEVKQEIMEFLVERMVSRLRTKQHLKHTDVDKLILQLQEQFPGDCGIFAPLVFNIVELKKGEGLFIDANEPHAYISGEILECMACSDNVVRAGLTPKLKDVPTLVNMLTYKCCVPTISKGEQVDKCLLRYCPPVEDFCVEIITVPPGQVYELNDVASPSVLLTLDGEACLKQSDVCSLDVSFGSSAFCSAQTTCTIFAGPYGVRLTRAFTNVFHKQQPE